MDKKKSFLIGFILIILMLLSNLLYFMLNKNSFNTKLPQQVTQRPEYLFSLRKTNYDDKLLEPGGVAVDRQGKIYVTDAGARKVQVYLPDGIPSYAFGEEGLGEGKFLYPYGILVLDNGDILVSDPGNYTLQQFSNKGKFIKNWLSLASKVKPGPLTRGRDGAVYLSDLASHQILVFDQWGNLKDKLADKLPVLQFPQGLGLDSKGNIWVADSGSNRVKGFYRNDALFAAFDGSDSTKAVPPFSMARGLAVDNLDRFVVADTVAHSLKFYDYKGKLLFTIPEKKGRGFYYPTLVTLDQTGKIYVVDWGVGQVQVWGYRD